MSELAVFLFGLIVGGSPVLVWLLLKRLKINLEGCESVKKDMLDTLTKFNSLYNSSVTNYNELNSRIQKLENEHVVQRFGANKL
jgi:hypothetical protein